MPAATLVSVLSCLFLLTVIYFLANISTEAVPVWFRTKGVIMLKVKVSLHMSWWHVRGRVEAE